jgi:uncharacterized protein (DUF885 family)
MKRHKHFLIAFSLLTASAQAQPADAAAAIPDLADAPSELRAHIERYAADLGTLQRYYIIDLSQERHRRLQKFYRDWLDHLETAGFDAMSQEGKADFILFRNHLQHQLRTLDLGAKHQAEAAPLVTFAPAIIDLENSRGRMDPVDSPKAAAVLSGLSKQAAELQRTIQKSLAASPPPKTVANRAAAEVAGLRAVLKRWFDFYNSYDPVFTWWAAQPYRDADAALQSYAVFLREEVAGVRGGGADLTAMAMGGRRPAAGRPVTSTSASETDPVTRARATARMDSTDDIIGEPIGREGIMSELAHEMIPYTPEDLIAIAEKEFVWCEDQMKRASRELGYGDDWKKALEHVKNMFVEPGKQPQLIRDLAREAETFLDQHDLITIPPLARETWRMEMMSPERQLINPFFTGGETISVSYPVESMTYEQKMMSMRGNNIPFSRATVFHELIPGHELQLYMAARHHSYRSLFNTPFLIEGWSLYWELLLWDLKFQKTPADRVGALFWRMHRCARIVFSLSFHLGKMTPQQCVDMLIDRGGHERANAIGEVRRSFIGADPPLYQAAYLLGGMQLFALHRELVDSGKMTNRQFHDAVLREGRMPIEMIRAVLTRQGLERDFTSNWKFSGVVIPVKP